MGLNLFGANISGQIAAALGPLLLPATLVKTTPGTRTAGDPTSGTNPTSASYPCRGMVSDYRVSTKPGDGQVAVFDKSIMLLGDTISGGAIVPTVNDRITIEGATYRIASVPARDPDAATYTMGCNVLSG